MALIMMTPKVVKVPRQAGKERYESR